MVSANKKQVLFLLLLAEMLFSSLIFAEEYRERRSIKTWYTRIWHMYIGVGPNYNIFTGDLSLKPAGSMNSLRWGLGGKKISLGMTYFATGPHKTKGKLGIIHPISQQIYQFDTVHFGATSIKVRYYFGDEHIPKPFFAFGVGQYVISAYDKTDKITMSVRVVGVPVEGGFEWQLTEIFTLGFECSYHVVRYSEGSFRIDTNQEYWTGKLTNKIGDVFNFSVFLNCRFLLIP
ncbi:MAG TPA: hypothetical protein DHV62_05950 [Elusimicrobia bacterium]|jgi:hypothetical protein|nr:hypothetical protein [Elusimicrobiota bacterium]